MNIRVKNRFPSSNKADDLARLQAIAEWRRIRLEEQEKALASNTQSSGTLVKGVLKHLKLDERLSETEILRVWQSTVDPNVSEHAQPVGLKNGTLFVDVDSAAWLSEIVRYRRREIIQQMQNAFGSKVIARISFRAAG